MRLEVVNNYVSNKINKKICLISDIHYYRVYNNELFNLIINNIRNNDPDYICILGDLIDNALFAKDPLINNIFMFVKDLGKICPVIISIGNHDVTANDIYYKNEEFFHHLDMIDNVTVLDNNEKVFNNIRFIGCTQNYELVNEESGNDDIVIKEANDLLHNLDSTKYNILLSHNPLFISKDYKKINNFDKVNLMLSGHTHGGFVPSFIKGNWGLISPCKKLFIKNARGSFKKGTTDIIICSGIIKLSYKSGIFRYLNFLYASSINYIYI